MLVRIGATAVWKPDGIHGDERAGYLIHVGWLRRDKLEVRVYGFDPNLRSAVLQASTRLDRLLHEGWARRA